MRRVARKESLFVVGIAAILSLVVFVGVHNSAWLLADITQTPTVTFADTSDLVTYLDDRGMHIAATKAFPKGQQMNIMLAYDPQTVTLAADDIASSFQMAFAPAGAGYATVSLQGDFSQLRKWDDLALINVNGNPTDITVADTVLIFADDHSDSLVIHVQ